MAKTVFRIGATFLAAIAIFYFVYWVGPAVLASWGFRQ
jgi:hypothetical protein